MQNENLAYISVNSLFLDIGECLGIILCYIKKFMIKGALGMHNRLKIQLTYVEQDTNIALNCNNIQIYNKKGTLFA